MWEFLRLRLGRIKSLDYTGKIQQCHLVVIKATVGGLPLLFTPGSKPKNGIPFLDQGCGRGLPPIFTPGSKPKKGMKEPKRGIP